MMESVDKMLPPTTLPLSSAERKDFPLYRGVLKYFPAAIAACARVSKVGNDKHNPGQELHHARGKSMDHADCILRHLMDLEEDFGRGRGYDEQGMPQVGYIVWRAMALAQEWLERNEGKPLAPGATLPPESNPQVKTLEELEESMESLRRAVRGPTDEEIAAQRAGYANYTPSPRQARIMPEESIEAHKAEPDPRRLMASGEPGNGCTMAGPRGFICTHHSPVEHLASDGSQFVARWPR